jgi:alpha,alpha-trehalose phosphorylase (configuration-retaining)
MKNKKKGAKKNNQIRPSVYAGISIESDGFFAAVRNGKRNAFSEFVKCPKSKLERQIFSWLHKFAIKNYVKIVGAGVVGDNIPNELTSDIWLKEDIVPYVFDIDSKNGKKKAASAAHEVAKKFGNDNIVDIKFDPERQVRTVRLARLEDIRKTADKEDYRKLIELADKFKRLEGKIIFFSSTPRGGGVALMRHALIRLFRLLDVDAHWYVMSSKKEIFNITKKKFHNVLQGVAPKGTILTEKDKQLFSHWTRKNEKRFEPILRKASVFVIDDPQPSGIIPYIGKVNPEAKIIYRSHIQIDADLMKKRGSVQSKIWEYLWKNIRQADLFVSHPIEKFIPHNVSKENTVLMGASTDKLDGLNKNLSKRQTDYYFNILNAILAKHRFAPLLRSRPFIVQIARFDPSKGIPDVLESYKILREKIEKNGFEKKRIPQLVIAGHTSIDDPEGSAIYRETLKIAEGKDYSKIKGDIKIVCLPHKDQIFNALISECFLALQLSHKEGFEIKVSEALNKGKPVVAYRTGGIPLQIENGVTGYLIECGSVKKVAERVYMLLTHQEKYRKMGRSARSRVKNDHFTVNNAAKWLFLATELMEKGKVRGKRQYVRDLMKK